MNFLNKVLKSESPSYLYNTIPNSNTQRQTRNEHKLKYKFQDSIDPMCCCSSSGVVATIHFFLHCENFNTQRQTLFDKITTTDANILTEKEDSYFYTLLFGQPNSENSFNKAMLNDTSIGFILSTERFNNPLF